MDPQEGARVTDCCELPNLGAKSKSRRLTHIVHVHIYSVKTKEEKKSIFKKFWPLEDQETAQLVMWLLHKHADLNSDHKNLCDLSADETIGDRQPAVQPHH